MVRRILAQDSEGVRRLEAALDERRQEIERQAARLAQTMESVERREQLLRDSRAALERLLRLGTSDLDSREAELVQLVRDVTEREERVRAEETELARRREELGAVEHKRAALESRERALEERELALAQAEAASAEPAPRLAFVPGSEYRLVDLEHEGGAEGVMVSLDGEAYVVARIGRSPLPGDDRRCAYLVRGPGDGSPRHGSP